MGDRKAEPSSSGIHISYNQRTGPDVNETRLSVKIHVDGRWIVALGALGLAAFYLSSPENKAKVAAALSNALGEKIGNITPGSLVVVVQCSSNQRFLRFWDDYQSGNIKKRLSEGFSKIGIEEVTVEIENEEEVVNKSEMFR